MPNGLSVTVLSPQLAVLHDRYQAVIESVEAASIDLAASQMTYWWGLWTIKRDKLYRAKGYLSEEQWLRSDLLAQAWAPSRSGYKSVMTAIADWYALKATDEQVQRLLADRKMAIESDLREWFIDGRRAAGLRPEVLLALAAKGETPLVALERIAALPPDQARAAAGEVIDRDYWRIIPETVHFLSGADKWNATVQHEHTRLGILEVGTLTWGYHRTDEHAPRKPAGFPLILARWLMSKFGLAIG